MCKSLNFLNKNAILRINIHMDNTMFNVIFLILNCFISFFLLILQKQSYGIQNIKENNSRSGLYFS